MTVQDTRRAVEAAAKAFTTFRNASPNQRQMYLTKFHQYVFRRIASLLSLSCRLCQDNIKDIARLITWENGKVFSDAMAEANYAASFLSWGAGEAVRTYGEVIPCSLPGTRNFVIKQPIGVCALLVP